MADFLEIEGDVTKAGMLQVADAYASQGMAASEAWIATQTSMLDRQARAAGLIRGEDFEITPALLFNPLTKWAERFEDSDSWAQCQDWFSGDLDQWLQNREAMDAQYLLGQVQRAYEQALAAGEVLREPNGTIVFRHSLGKLGAVAVTRHADGEFTVNDRDVKTMFWDKAS